MAQPVDEQGMIVDGLHADAVIVTPAHQFPTGSVLSGERRRELIAWARTTGGLIIEDDYDSKFRYDGDPVRALRGLAPDHVAYLGIVSKTLAPALRLGWLIVPNALAARATATKRLLDDFSPALNQMTLRGFLTRGDYDRHVRRARGVPSPPQPVDYASRDAPPHSGIEGVAAGVHLVVRAPVGVDDLAIARSAEDNGIRVSALSSFYVASTPQVGGLVIGYGRLRESAVDPAIQSLAEAMRPYLWLKAT